MAGYIYACTGSNDCPVMVVKRSIKLGPPEKPPTCSVCGKPTKRIYVAVPIQYRDFWRTPKHLLEG